MRTGIELVILYKYLWIVKPLPPSPGVMGYSLVPLPIAREKKEGTSRTRRYGYRLEMQGAKVNSLTELKYYFCTQVSKYVLLPRFFYVINIVAYKMNLSPLVYISAAWVGKTGVNELVQK